MSSRVYREVSQASSDGLGSDSVLQLFYYYSWFQKSGLSLLSESDYSTTKREVDQQVSTRPLVRALSLIRHTVIHYCDWYRMRCLKQKSISVWR